MLDAFERWALVENACRRAGRWLDPHQRQRIEDRAEADHRRFDALMREIRARLDG
ncbi:MAG: hypothetical protein HY319_16905 [Armatimonadetes bacterium]|nr:hypothetical protein [Armatimonadota bacterium]